MSGLMRRSLIVERSLPASLFLVAPLASRPDTNKVGNARRLVATGLQTKWIHIVPRALHLPKTVRIC
jgi:hypothetical protein